MNLFQKIIINRILFRRTRANRCLKQFERCFGSMDERAADLFLTVLLNLMSLILCLNPEYRLNIKDFEAKYVFKGKSKKLYVTAEFKNNKLAVKQKQIQNPELTLTFKDGNSLFKLLLSDTPDVLNAMLNQEVDFCGNINYLNKFAYMAMRLKLMAAGKV